MKIALAYNGFLSTALVRGGQPLPEDLENLATTHMSEVNHLLVCHWLREMGHEVYVLTAGEPSATTHFPSQVIDSVVSSDWDVLLLWKVHGLKLAKKHGLLKKFGWRRVVAWLDSLNPEKVIGDDATFIDTFAWGTPDILKKEKHKWEGNAQQFVCEHATAFFKPPEVKATAPHGLYLGRLPNCYLSEVLHAAKHCHMAVYALWLQTHSQKILLRPGQYQDGDLAMAREYLSGSNLTLYPGTNVLANGSELSKAAFGLCSATGPRPKIQHASASKFYDYTAMGLPVVLADNTPEVEHVKKHPYLGELYDQGQGGSLKAAIERAIASSQQSGFAERRRKIQEWTFNNATYKHRAETINDHLR